MQYIVQILLLMLSCTSIFVINQFRLNFWPFFVVVIVTKYFKNGMELDTFDYKQKKREQISSQAICCSDHGCLVLTMQQSLEGTSTMFRGNHVKSVYKVSKKSEIFIGQAGPVKKLSTERYLRVTLQELFRFCLILDPKSIS